MEQQFIDQHPGFSEREVIVEPDRANDQIVARPTDRAARREGTEASLEQQYGADFESEEHFVVEETASGYRNRGESHWQDWHCRRKHDCDPVPGALTMWHFDPKETAMDVYDHTGSLIVEDRAFGTNDAGDNGAWTGDYPDEVLAVMDEAFVAEVQASGLTTYAGQCLRHGAFELVEQGVS